MSQSYQIQQKTVTNHSSFSDDLNDNKNDNILLINDKVFSSNWMNDEFDGQEKSSFPLPRVVARMPKLTFSDSDNNQPQRLGKTIFVMLASRKKRWISIFGSIVFVAIGLGIWMTPEKKTDLPVATDDSSIEPAVVFESNRSQTDSNGLTAMTSNAIKSLSDQQNAFPADYSIDAENVQNNNILTALHFDTPNSVYSSNELPNPSETNSSFDHFSSFNENSESLENSSFESSIPNASYASKNSIPSSYQSNAYSPQSEFNNQSQNFENVPSSNQNAIWINDAPFDYSSANQYTNSSSSGNNSNTQNNWNDLQNEPLLNNKELNQNNSTPQMKNGLQRFTPTSQNTQDIRLNSTSNHYSNNAPNQYNINNPGMNNQNANINQGYYSPVPNQNNVAPTNSNGMNNPVAFNNSAFNNSMNKPNNSFVENNSFGNNNVYSPNQKNQTINYSSSNRGFDQYRH